MWRFTINGALFILMARAKLSEISLLKPNWKRRFRRHKNE